MAHREYFSDHSKQIMQGAYHLASELTHGFVGSDHILHSLSKDEKSAAGKALRDCGLDYKLIRDIIEKFGSAGGPGGDRVQGLTPDAARVIESAESQAQKLGHKKVDPEHILLGILQERNSIAARIIVSTGGSLSKLTSELLRQLNKTWPRVVTAAPPAEKKRETKSLDKYSLDLTKAAAENRLDPVIGRETEISRTVQILSRRTKNNPVLIGEPGVGKTAIGEGLAQRIISGDVPENLAGKRLVSLDLTKMLSGAKFRGDFEERIKSSIEDAANAGNVILFIDELHTIIGAGASEGAMDAANILKPALSRGEVQVIGATTLAEYRKHIEKDAALERRFQSITIEEPSKEDAQAILLGLRARYEDHHKLTITTQAIEAAVLLSARYIQDRYLPDKAIDLVDEAASRVRTRKLTIPQEFKEKEQEIEALNADKSAAARAQDFELAAEIRDRQAQMRGELDSSLGSWREAQSSTVTPEDIASVVSAWTGIPVTMLTEDESARLVKMEEELHTRVIGQDEAVTAVSKAIRRGRVGLKDPRRPLGSFLFLGPTGVGKTELCKALAETLFRDEDAIIRVDMSEFMERHTVSKLIGSPPGYVGYDEAGQLTEKIRRRPYSVVLFDEIEKAHPDVWSILLQIMEDGRLTDSHGRKVDFKHAIVVMTSNIGARSITDKRAAPGFSVAQATDTETRPLSEIKEKVMKELKETFKPEFLNRIDDAVVFHQLSKDNIREIARIMLRDLEKRMAELEIGLLADDAALDFLADKGFDPVYGARPLRRAIQSGLEDIAAERILEGEFSAGDIMLVSAEDGALVIKKAERHSFAGLRLQESKVSG
ncbi:MAG: ATP-dependent Clp protease ATP-binding subunit [Oscillospiraceae bacterium]|nr:ATP-dependent Clp protease ATP-binding subunit [Oscillospiraceae bacterium]